MNLDFSGKTAIVTGAAHGFGRAISLAFAERGAHVWAIDVLGDELRETEALGRGARGVLFFASEYAGWISGQVLSIDGGK